MKYKDKHTIKSTYHWRNKLQGNESNEWTTGRNSTKAELKRRVILFGARVDDIFWWNSLTEKQKINVYVEYCDFANDYWVLPSTTYYVPKFPNLSDEEHQLRINFLKQKYSDTSKRRNLVINDILDS